MGKTLCRVAPTSSTLGGHALLAARQVGVPHTEGHRRGRPSHPTGYPRTHEAGWLAGTRMFSAHGSSLLGIPGSHVLAEPQQPFP